MPANPQRIIVRHMGQDVTVTATLVREGSIETVKGRERRVGQVYEITLDGERIGYAHYRLVTRERRTPGKRYVNARWYSPAWLASQEEGYAPPHREQSSRKAVIESLLWDHRQREKGQSHAD